MSCMKIRSSRANASIPLLFTPVILVALVTLVALAQPLSQGAPGVARSPSGAIVLTTSNTNKLDEARTAVIKINGMICESCERSIQARLGKMDGVRAVKISARKGVAEVVFAANGKATPRDMVKAIEDLGEYKALIVKVF